MLKHIVAWNFKDGMSEEQKRDAAQMMKAEIEGLLGIIPELKEMEVLIDLLPRSNREIALISSFEDEDALQTYIDHPEHIRVVKKILPNIVDRVAIDYYV